jgi:DNA-binding PadR family transcriptional regulator
MDEHEHHHHGEHHGFGLMGGGMGFGVRRGEFRFLILIALSQKPMHGYALIREIGRTYQRPVSAGMVYPTLQELEDMGLVISEEKEAKKVYSITEEGREHLTENEDIVSRLKAGQEYASKVGQFSFMKDLRDVQAMIMMNADYVDKEKMEKIEAILTDAKRKVAAIVYQ